MVRTEVVHSVVGNALFLNRESQSTKERKRVARQQSGFGVNRMVQSAELGNNFASEFRRDTINAGSTISLSRQHAEHELGGTHDIVE